VPRHFVENLAPGTVAYALVPVDNMWSPDEIKEALRSSVTGLVIPRPGPDGALEDNLAVKDKKLEKRYVLLSLSARNKCNQPMHGTGEHSRHSWLSVFI
jgi:hypothetical protein